MPEGNKDELAVVYASLILQDDKIPITEDKISTLLEAANVSVQPFWPSFFSQLLSRSNVEDLILKGGGGGGGGAAASVGAASTSAAAPAAKEEKKEEKKVEEKKEESDDDMGFGLFD